MIKLKEEREQLWNALHPDDKLQSAGITTMVSKVMK